MYSMWNVFNRNQNYPRQLGLSNIPVNGYVKSHKLMKFLVCKTQHVRIIGSIVQLWIWRYGLSSFVNSVKKNMAS